jgi:hypothetical protein
MAKLFQILDTTNGQQGLKSLTGADVGIDTTNFNNNLNNLDTNLQTALDTIDDLVTDKVKASINDTTSGYLVEKLTSLDSSVIITNNTTSVDLKAKVSEAVNIETLMTDKILTATDAPIQIYTINHNTNINLPTTNLVSGQKFEIWNNNAYNSNYNITIRQGGGVIYSLTSQTKIALRWDGANWIPVFNNNVAIGLSTDGNYTSGTGIGAYANNNNSYGVGVGYSANSNHDSGVGIGNGANNNYTSGVGVGYNARNNYTSGTGVGYYAYNNYNYGTGVGAFATTNSKQYNTIALGAFSKAERNRELVSTATQDYANKAQLTFQKFKETTFNNSGDTPIELFIDGGSARLVILNNSVYNFIGECNVIVTAGDLAKIGCAKSWQFAGVIRRKQNITITYTERYNTIVFNDGPECPELDLIGFSLSADSTNYSLKPTITRGVGQEALTFEVSLNIRATETRI